MPSFEIPNDLPFVSLFTAANIAKILHNVNILYDHSYIRKTSIKVKIPYVATLASAVAAAKGIPAYRKGKGSVRSLQSYHGDIH